jgi:hypothetical protein
MGRDASGVMRNAFFVAFRIPPGIYPQISQISPIRFRIQSVQSV